jgi:hypothetical protein
MKLRIQADQISQYPNRPIYKTLKSSFFVTVDITRDELFNICKQRFPFWKHDSVLFNKKVDEIFKSSEKLNIHYLLSVFMSGMCMTRWSPMFYLDRGFSEEESKQLSSEFQTKNSNKYQQKYKNNPENYVSSFSTRIEFYLKKGMSQEDAEKALKDRQTTRSKEKFIKKYGEQDGLKRFNELNERWVSTLKSKDNYADICARKSSSLQNLQRKLGIKKGMEEYYKRHKTAIDAKNEQIAKKGRQTSASYRSLLVFLPIYDALNKEYGLYLGVQGSKEFKIYIKDTRSYRFYDFTIEYLKLIFEYHGNGTHPNKAKMTTEEWQSWKQVFNKDSADTVYVKDVFKKELAESLGFTVITLWGSDSVEFNQQRVINAINSKLLSLGLPILELEL